jgi:hypothetical protein
MHFSKVLVGVVVLQWAENAVRTYEERKRRTNRRGILVKR